MTGILRFVDQSGQIRVGVRSQGGDVCPLKIRSLSALLSLPLVEIRSTVESALLLAEPSPSSGLLPPVDGRMEVWASGVTYARSRDARIEESLEQDVYERVYSAERPELFLKSTPSRVMTDGEPIGIRGDSVANVPEPELAVVANTFGEIVGVLVCDDVSSRSIEGENPLYLPQAKVYAGSCALSPEILPIWELERSSLHIDMTIEREGRIEFAGSTDISRMSRSFEDLVAWLFRADHFPDGVVLSTGTGIVPALSFSLEPGDTVRIEIPGVGVLENHVVRGVESIVAALHARPSYSEQP